MAGLPRAHDLGQILAERDQYERHLEDAVAHLWDVYLAVVEAVGPKPSWQARAACRGQTSAMFPARGQSTGPAKRLCAGCEVRAECLLWALDNPTLSGILGGLSDDERRRLRRSAA